MVDGVKNRKKGIAMKKQRIRRKLIISVICIALVGTVLAGYAFAYGICRHLDANGRACQYMADTKVFIGESDNQFAQHQYKLLDFQGNPTGSYATCTYSYYYKFYNYVCAAGHHTPGPRETIYNNDHTCGSR